MLAVALPVSVRVTGKSCKLRGFNCLPDFLAPNLRMTRDIIYIIGRRVCDGIIGRSLHFNSSLAFIGPDCNLTGAQPIP